MRYSLFVLLLPLFCGALMAGPVLEHDDHAEDLTLPVPFTGILYARHPGSFYDRQAADWEAVALGDCATDEAWWHYYKTAHYSNRFGSGEYDLAGILAKAEKVLDPAGFEIHYLRFVGDQNPDTRYVHLMKAQEVSPDRLEAATALSAYYTIEGRTQERNAMLSKMHRNRPLPQGVMEYNYNQLMSVETGAVLITNGDSDTFPAWLLQSEFGVRPDVTVLSLPLLMGIARYRDHARSVLEKKDLFAMAPTSAASLLAELSGLDRPLYIAATGQHLFADLPAEKLYVTGLAFRYSNKPVNNLGQLAKNYSEAWRLEHARNPLDNSPGQAVADQLNQNYLPALFELHAYYLDNPSPEFRDLRSLIGVIAERAGLKDEVEIFLQGDSPIVPLASNAPGVRAKDILKRTVFIPGGVLKSQYLDGPIKINGFSMQETEVTNADYQLFLEDLLRQRRFDLLDSVAVQPINFRELFPTGSTDALAEAVNAGHAAYDNYPVVNLPHHAAELYARWLTEAYNQDPKRKDGRNVRFRLPTREEFEFAFTGGRANVPYPWGGPYFRNSKGCYLANFNTDLEVREKDLFPASQFNGRLNPERIEEGLKKANDPTTGGCTDTGSGVDGGFFTVAVDAYFPNDYGLYNMAGNAAEMLNEAGETMGGSWLSHAYNMQAGVITKRNLPHPSTGFRLVMVYE